MIPQKNCPFYDQRHSLLSCDRVYHIVLVPTSNVANIFSSSHRCCYCRCVATAISCGSAVTDAAVAAFARGCRKLKRLCLRGVVGVPPPLGAAGILAVCCHCRELEALDLGEVWGLEDSALLGFHDYQMEKLEKVSKKYCTNTHEWVCPALKEETPSKRCLKKMHTLR